MTNLTSEQKQDLESLIEIFDAIGIGESMQDGAYGYSFNDEELSEAFEKTKKLSDLIHDKYNRLTSVE